MRIRVADSKVGECIVNSERDIGKMEEYAIKSLCMLQLMCMNKEEDDQKFGEFLGIMSEAIKKAKNLYKGNTDEPGPLDHIRL